MKQIKKIKKVIVMFLLFSLVAFMSGCNSENKEGKIDNNGLEVQKANLLLNTQYKFIAYSLDDEWVKATPNSNLTIKFNKEKFNGNAGCNGFFGSYKQNGTLIEINGIGSTKMYCEGEIMAQEDTFLQSLEKVTSINIQENQLFLEYENSALVFEKIQN